MERNNIKSRRYKVKELYKEGRNQKEIAQELGVSQKIISNDIKYLREQGEITEKLQHTILTEASIEKLCKDFYGQRSTEEQFERYILQCKNRFAQDMLKREEIPMIEKVAKLTEKYKDIAFYLKVSIRFGQFRQAMIFANNQMNNEVLTKEEKAKIRKLREVIQELNKKYIAIKELEKGGGIQQVIKCSGLSETEVINLNRILLQKNEKAKRRKEKNDSEGPKK